MVSETEFNEAAVKVKTLKARPTDQELLDLYALFKQATVGDCNTDRPGIIDFKGKAKWDVWDAKKGTSKQEAMDNYVVMANGLIQKYGVS